MKKQNKLIKSKRKRNIIENDSQEIMIMRLPDKYFKLIMPNMIMEMKKSLTILHRTENDK